MLFNYLLILLLLASVAISALAAADPMQIAKDGCPSNCGSIEIPFPFGTKNECYFNEPGVGLSYSIMCTDTGVAFTPIYNKNILLLSISLQDHTLSVASSVAYQCYADNTNTTPMVRKYLDMMQFTASITRNMFVAIGCDTQANVVGDRRIKDDGLLHYATGCSAFCYSREKVNDGTCSGVGCCETPIPDRVTRTEISAWSYFNHTNFQGFNNCSVAAVVENGAPEFSVEDILHMGDSELRNLTFPMVFDWWIVGSRCDDLNKKLCGANSYCTNYVGYAKGGYRCNCKRGFKGNPYLPDGCQDFDECSQELEQIRCEKREYCTNTIGDYECACSEGFSGKGTKESHCYANVSWWKSLKLEVKILFGGCVGLVFFLSGLLLFVLYKGKKMMLELRERLFRQNGGLILCQKLYGRDIYPQKFLIFTAEELENATTNYNESSIIGRGGFGVVYKGVLPNGQVVAIKRSLEVDPAQVEHFINEILVLSEINNKNVVKLLGCCLETEVPLLVYEFINNGTLYEHLHDDRRATLLSWDIRLSVAESVASVLSYLHTMIAIPIIHRDIKSMNILLDEDYSAKVSDFGASKLGSMDQDQLATMVSGTWGYLDPEYMQSSALTEKSDVYSFGVVLVELLTRKKAFSCDSPEDERCLAKHFLCKLKEDRLFDIIDERIAKIENLEQIKNVANVAKQCLHVRGDERPTMKEVATELEVIKKIERQQPLYEVEAQFIDECELLLIETLVHSEGSSGTQFSDSQTISLMGLNDGR